MRLYLSLFLLLLAAAVLYWPGLSGGFVFDDYSNIIGNPTLRLFNGSLASLVDASTGGIASPFGRPLSMASFAVNYHYGGELPFGFKLVNLLVHLSNGVLIFLLARRLLPRLTDTFHSGWAALWVAALWLLHPINLTPVLFVVQRMTSLSALFTLLALLLYLRGRESRGVTQGAWLVASLLICWPVGVLAKETALLLPLYLLLIEGFCLGRMRMFSPRKLYLFAGLMAVLAVTVLFWWWPFVLSTYQYRDFSLGERMLTEARVLWIYAGQLLLPWPDNFALHHDDIPLSHSLIDPVSTSLAVAGLLAVLGIAFNQRRRRPWLSFSILWFLVGHILESSLLGLEIAYEHRNYLPSLGVFIGLAIAVLPDVRRRVGEVPRWAAALAMVAFCTLVTGLRAMQWSDGYLRTQIEAMTHPQSVRTQHEAGQAILSRAIARGMLDDTSYKMARAHFLSAVDLDPQTKGPFVSILFLDCTMGVRLDESLWSELLARMAGARFVPGEERFVHGLADLLSNNRLCLSLEQTDALISAGLSNPTAYPKMRGMLHAVAMGSALARRNDLKLARSHAEAAVSDDPGSAVQHINLIRLLLLNGDIESARREYAVLARLSIPPASRKEVEEYKRVLAY